MLRHGAVPAYRGTAFGSSDILLLLLQLAEKVRLNQGESLTCKAVFDAVQMWMRMPRIGSNARNLKGWVESESILLPSSRAFNSRVKKAALRAQGEERVRFADRIYNDRIIDFTNADTDEARADITYLKKGKVLRQGVETVSGLAPVELSRHRFSETWFTPLGERSGQAMKDLLYGTKNGADMGALKSALEGRFAICVLFWVASGQRQVSNAMRAHLGNVYGPSGTLRIPFPPEVEVCLQYDAEYASMEDGAERLPAADANNVGPVQRKRLKRSNLLYHQYLYRCQITERNEVRRVDEIWCPDGTSVQEEARRRVVNGTMALMYPDAFAQADRARSAASLQPLAADASSSNPPTSSSPSSPPTSPPSVSSPPPRSPSVSPPLASSPPPPTTSPSASSPRPPSPSASPPPNTTPPAAGAGEQQPDAGGNDVGVAVIDYLLRMARMRVLSSQR